MFNVAILLLLSLSAPQDVPTVKAELKDIPAKGAEAPLILCEGSTSLSDGAVLGTYLYYGRIIEGKELFRDFATVKAGKFTQDFPIFPKRNLPGKYTVRLTYNPGLQVNGVADFAPTRVDVELQIGNADDYEREAKVVRDQLVAEIRGLAALGDQVKAKIKELQGKPADAWAPLIAGWHAQTIEIQRRTLPRSVPEYKVLNLDLIADTGMENLCSIFLSAARCAAGGQPGPAVEGLTRLRQTAEYWTGEIASPKLTDPLQMVALIENARKLLREALANPDAPVLPARRKFVEMNALLDKSVPEDFHPSVLEIGSRSVAYFNALADKQAGAKELHAELDKALERISAALRTLK
jgi:hypothetical protein